MAARSISAALPRLLRLCLKLRSLPAFLNAPSELIAEARAVDRCDAFAMRHSSILFANPCDHKANKSVGEKGSFSKQISALRCFDESVGENANKERRREGKLLQTNLGFTLL
jgi:hypothetical protein